MEDTMIPKDELDKAVEIARKYQVGELYLIGPALYKRPEELNDYDFAVRDVPVGNFFRFYGELFREMSKNVNLIDLSSKMTKSRNIILREGELIYAKHQLKEYCEAEFENIDSVAFELLSIAKPGKADIKV